MTLTLFSGAPGIVRVGCVVMLLIGALHDVAARTIPNWVPGVLAAIGVLTLIASHAGAERLLAAAVLFGGALVVWRLGWLGGGDAKLLGAVGLMLTPDRMLAAVAVTGLSGALLALPYIACRGRLHRPAAQRPARLAARCCRVERFRLRRGGPLPYGVAIAIGASVGLLGGAS